MIIPQLEGLTLTKAHGAGNDFILVPDPSGQRTIPAEAVAQVCDRHFGIGADGLIRIVRTATVPEVAHMADQAEWFMDYRNADGSLAEMCGNGVRVFVHYLRIQGFIDMAPGDHVAVATRGGIKDVCFDAPYYTVDMGPYELPDGVATSHTVGLDGVSLPGLAVDMPNPHVVVELQDVADLEAVTWTPTPTHDPEPSNGTNLEIMVRTGEETEEDGTVHGLVTMRVLERGVGETLACGTGTCAVAVAAMLSAPDAPSRYRITTPGGELIVRIEGQNCYLTGPAILVAEVGLIGLPGYSEE